MSHEEANEIRLIANQIMWRLYESGKREQLELLRMYAARAIQEIDKNLEQNRFYYTVQGNTLSQASLDQVARFFTTRE